MEPNRPGRSTGDPLAKGLGIAFESLYNELDEIAADLSKTTDDRQAIRSARMAEMADTQASQDVVADPEQLKREWLDHLTALVETVEGWARELGWSTRRVEKTMKDSELGRYKAPALMIQEEFTRGLLEPIYHCSPGTEGTVDLYLMPAYDDVARLFFSDGKWSLYRMPPGVPAVGTYEEAGPGTLSKETFREVLEGMKEYEAR